MSERADGQCKARVQLDARLYLAFAQVSFRRGLIRSLPRLAVLLTVSLVLVLALGEYYRWLLLSVAGGFAIVALVIGVRWVMLGWHTRRIFAESAVYREPLLYVFDEAGFTADHTSGHLRQLWTDLVRWEETPILIALFTNRIQGSILPKAQVNAGTIDFVRQQLASSGLAKPGKRRK